MISEHSKTRIKFIIEHLANKFGLNTQEVIDPGRKEAAVTARRIAISLCREHTFATYKEIAAFFSDRNHATIIHHIKTHEDLLTYDRKYRDMCNEIKQAFVGPLWTKEVPPQGYTLTDGHRFFGYFLSHKNAMKFSHGTDLTVVNIYNLKARKEIDEKTKDNES